MRDAWITHCPEGKCVCERYTSRLADQPSDQEMARQVTVKVQDLGTIGHDAPEQGHEQDIFQAGKKKTDLFHFGLMPPSPRS